MGSGQSGYSQADFDRYSTELYEASLPHKCIFPDLGIDESLLKYSGSDSNAVLQAYAREPIAFKTVDQLQGYMGKVESVFKPMTSVPHAVGFGAFVIYMVLELYKRQIEKGPASQDTYSMIQRVFAEEKASSVRDTMSTIMDRIQILLNNEQELLEEMQRLEKKLNDQLPILRNSLLLDGQMSTRGFKIWVNGAAFHLQMLIHEARLNTGNRRTKNIQKIKAAISLYLLHLDQLQEKYKTYKSSTNFITFQLNLYVDGWLPSTCTIENSDDKNCRNLVFETFARDPCGSKGLNKAYTKEVFSKYEPILGLKTYFSNINSNLDTLINQSGSFTLPSADLLL